MGTVPFTIAVLLLPASIFAAGPTFTDSIPLPRNDKTQPPANMQELKPRFSHRTSKGAIYILPIDNMPCLVPYSTSKMPGQYNYRMPDMPNPSPRYRIEPDAGKKKR
jgi:hypothetical protein